MLNATEQIIGHNNIFYDRYVAFVFLNLFWYQKRIKELKDTKTSSDKKLTPQRITPEMREQMLSEIALSNLQQNISRQFGESE